MTGAAGEIPQIGVGLQVNPRLDPWFKYDEHDVDLFEILLDTLVGPLDGPYILLPEAAETIAPFRKRAPLIAHSNYGGDFGFGPIEESVAVRRHIPAARFLNSPWVADHAFYGDHASREIWSCPLQFSRAERTRIASRARQLQELYGIPLLHENAAYYFPFPGAEMEEAEFLAGVVEEAGTYLHLDLHNVYTNSRNLPAYRSEDFLATIPMDRVIAIHLAGGSMARGVYHDWHDSPVPEPVWEMLEHVLRATRVKAVIIEYQGRAHHEDARVLSEEVDRESIARDLERAMGLWDKVYGPGHRHSQRSNPAGAA